MFKLALIFAFLMMSYQGQANCQRTPEGQDSYQEISVVGCEGNSSRFCVESVDLAGKMTVDEQFAKNCIPYSNFSVCVFKGEKFSMTMRICDEFSSLHCKNNQKVSSESGNIDLANCL